MRHCQQRLTTLGSAFMGGATVQWTESTLPSVLGCLAAVRFRNALHLVNKCDISTAVTS